MRMFTHIVRPGIRPVSLTSQLLAGMVVLIPALWLPIARAQQSTTNDEQQLEEIIVTGSHIARSGFDTPAPMTTIDAGEIQQSGFASVGDVLLQTPSIGVGTGSATRGGNGAAFVNLRGLGTNRSLTLINGNRRVSGSTSGSAVDLNAIPGSMIERIEVITGGSSAVYGADAVSGVVNVILRDDFEGLQFTGSGGASQEGGAENLSLSLHGGTSFASGRGSVGFGASYSKTEPLFIRDRDYDIGAVALDNPDYTGSEDEPIAFLIQDWIFYLRPYSGGFTVDDTLYTYVDNGLRPVAFTPGYGEGIVDSGPNKDPQGYYFGDFAALRNAIDVASFRTNAKFDLTDNIEFFAEAELSTVNASDVGTVNLFLGSPLARENPLLPAEVTALMDANAVSSISVDRYAIDYGVQVKESDRDTWTMLSGLRGQLTNGWSWRVTGQYGEYTINSRTPNTVISPNYLNAIDTISDPATGDPVCRDVAARSAGCSPLNILGRNVASQAALDYILHTRLQTTTNTQRIVSAQLTGDLFSLPAGDFGFAFGIDSRAETISIRDDGLATQGLLNRIAGQPALDADFDVNEAYVEVLAPIVADKPFFRSLNLEAAIRVSDYNTIGRTNAWKVGGDWSPVDDLRFRFTASTSVRAPNLNELYTPRSERATLFLDPCQPGLQVANPNRPDNCAALGIPEGLPLAQADSDGVIASGGNPALTEEESDSYTLGLVFTPSRIEGLQLSVDYWEITIGDAIENLGSKVLERCVDASSINNPFCPLVTRNPGPDYTIERVDVIDINVSELTARGIDFAARYGFEATAGYWDISLLGTKLIQHESLVDPTDSSSLVPSLDLLSHPELRMTLNTQYSRDHWSLSMINRYVSSRTLDNMTPNFFPPDQQYIPSDLYTDLRFTYDPGQRYRLFAGINNVMAVEPPSAWLGGGGGGVNDGALADGIGRFFHGGVTFDF